MVDGKAINIDVLKRAAIQEQWNLSFVLEQNETKKTLLDTEVSIRYVEIGRYYFVTINGSATEDGDITELQIKATYDTESTPRPNCRLRFYFNYTTVNGEWIGNMSSKRGLAIRCLDILENAFVNFVR